jgi:hypothetical protein
MIDVHSQDVTSILTQRGVVQLRALTAFLTQRDDVQSQALTQIQLSQWPPNENKLCEACKFNEFYATCSEEYKHDCTCGEENYMDAH